MMAVKPGELKVGMVVKVRLPKVGAHRDAYVTHYVRILLVRLDPDGLLASFAGDIVRRDGLPNLHHESHGCHIYPEDVMEIIYPAEEVSP
jgi:hypothetical protein